MVISSHVGRLGIGAPMLDVWCRAYALIQLPEPEFLNFQAPHASIRTESIPYNLPTLSLVIEQVLPQQCLLNVM